MIKVTRLNDSVMVINVEKIQSVQSTPDTVITFTNHDRIMVKEQPTLPRRYRFPGKCEQSHRLKGLSLLTFRITFNAA